MNAGADLVSRGRAGGVIVVVNVSCSEPTAGRRWRRGRARPPYIRRSDSTRVDARRSPPLGGMPAARRVVALHVQRHGGVQRRCGQVCCGGGLTVEPATDPSGATKPTVQRAVHPDAHRGEVRQVRVGVADALDRRHLAGVVQRLEVASAAERSRRSRRSARTCAGRDRDVRPLAVVVAVAVRHEHVFSPSMPPYRVITITIPSAGTDRRVPAQAVGMLPPKN